MKKFITVTAIIIIVGLWAYYLYQNIFALTSKSEIAEITKNLPSPTTIIIPTDKPTPTPAFSDLDLIKLAFAEKHGKPVSEVILTISENNGLTAQGSISFVGENGGAWWLAAKVKNVWIAVQDGNGYVACESVTDYKFPKSMVPECVDVNGKLKIL
ncbi:MAG: hypothetical protein NTY75_01990 [Candidatus Shapirobacteria bacterium]|nr:hypothetical protein [Candidatus Shapirobacteria bacterium]